MPGMFITFEGIEGVGKTTQIKKTFELLSSNGGHVLLTREPGGTEVGEAIRNVMLHSTEFKIEGTPTKNQKVHSVPSTVFLTG